MSVVGVIGLLRNDGGRHRIPGIQFGVWFAHPANTFDGPEEMWRVSHGPTGKAVFCTGADTNWFIAIRIAEEMDREFGSSTPTPAQAKAVFEGVMRVADDFIRNATDWLK